MSVVRGVGVPSPAAIGVPPAAGTPVVLQGAYGDRGNLELLFPDPTDGLWVCWRNNDVEPVGEVGPGEWSGGLRFAAGERYDDVAFLQARRGPDFLEVLASTGDRLDRWTWSPGPGFERTGVLRVPEVDLISDVHLVETHRGFVAMARTGATCLQWRADGTTYPHLASAEPTRFDLPDDVERLSLTVGRDDAVRCVAVRSGRLWRCDDLAIGDWAALGLDDVRAVCAVAPSPRTSTGRPYFLVATGQRLTAVGGTGDVDVEHAILGVDALAAGISHVEEASLEVVVRVGSELQHLTVPR